jgi:hypothetical protein
MTSNGLIRNLAIVLTGTLLSVAGFPAAAVEWNKRVKTWYLQTVATNSSGAMDDRSGVIGHISEGAAGYDKHDIPAFASVSGAPVAVIFHQDDSWGEHAGEYLSDYRAPGKTKQVWDFTVTASNPDDTVTLSWDGLHIITQHGAAGFATRLDRQNNGLRILRLIDLSLGRIATRAANNDGSLATYTFQMGGVHERHFRWISGNPTVEELTSPNALPVDADVQQTTADGAQLRSLSAPVVEPVNDFPPPPPLATPDSEKAVK